MCVKRHVASVLMQEREKEMEREEKQQSAMQKNVGNEGETKRNGEMSKGKKKLVDCERTMPGRSSPLLLARLHNSSSAHSTVSRTPLLSLTTRCVWLSIVVTTDSRFFPRACTHYVFVYVCPGSLMARFTLSFIFHSFFSLLEPIPLFFSANTIPPRIFSTILTSWY